MTAFLRIVRLAAAIVAAAVPVGLTSRASVAPLSYQNGTSFHLRPLWSARPERIEICRTLPPEELAQCEAVEHERRALVVLAAGDLPQ